MSPTVAFDNSHTGHHCRCTGRYFLLSESTSLLLHDQPPQEWSRARFNLCITPSEFHFLAVFSSKLDHAYKKVFYISRVPSQQLQARFCGVPSVWVLESSIHMMTISIRGHSCFSSIQYSHALPQPHLGTASSSSSTLMGSPLFGTLPRNPPTREIYLPNARRQRQYFIWTETGEFSFSDQPANSFETVVDSSGCFADTP